jgi:DNA-binding LacI/PurR family transcriptional regulator
MGDTASMPAPAHSAVPAGAAPEPAGTRAARAPVAAAASAAAPGVDAGSVGLVVLRRAGSAGLDPFWGELVRGMEEALDAADRTVLMQIARDPAEELEVYRRWAADPGIVGVLVGDLVDPDPRGALLEELGLPAVLLGDADDARHTTVVVDDSAPMHAAVAHLASLGHRRIARIAGREELRHTRSRGRAFDAAVAAAGVEGVTVHGDYAPASGDALTRALLAEDARPTAIVYDNDAMAVAGLHAARALGLEVPGDVSLLAWDDSALCRLSHPPLSAMRREVHELGGTAAGALLDVVAGRGRHVLHVGDATLVSRGTTGPPPGA